MRKTLTQFVLFSHFINDDFMTGRNWAGETYFFESHCLTSGFYTSLYCPIF